MAFPSRSPKARRLCCRFDARIAATFAVDASRALIAGRLLPRRGPVHDGKQSAPVKRATSHARTARRDSRIGRRAHESITARGVLPRGVVPLTLTNPTRSAATATTTMSVAYDCIRYYRSGDAELAGAITIHFEKDYDMVCKVTTVA